MADKPLVELAELADLTEPSSSCLLKPKSLLRKPAKAKLLNRSVISPTRQATAKEVSRIISKKVSPDKPIRVNG